MLEIKTRCKQGTLIITDQQIRVELGQLNQKTLSRSAVTGVDSVMAVPSVFGMGGGTNLTFHGQGDVHLHADMVKTNIAKEIVSMINK